MYCFFGDKANFSEQEPPAAPGRFQLFSPSCEEIPRCLAATGQVQLLKRYLGRDGTLQSAKRLDRQKVLARRIFGKHEQ
jgi:hypothetical protein